MSSLTQAENFNKPLDFTRMAALYYTHTAQEEREMTIHLNMSQKWQVLREMVREEEILIFHKESGTLYSGYDITGPVENGGCLQIDVEEYDHE